MIGTFKLPIVNNASLIAQMFEGRVTFDAGTFEAQSCLVTFLNKNL